MSQPVVGDPPGSPARDPAATAEMASALAARGPAYRPRTRHLDAAGGPRFTNRLIRESSPYLLQHAHNPVDWWPWGSDAFTRAAELRRPVLLSIGYATCHWCHVMEEESFEDLEIASALNARYVCIKVDREERPDVDAVYMAAVQAFTGRGGWPMTVWLTERREPFFAATYLPPRDGQRGMAKGFLSILEHLATVHAENPAGVTEQAGKFVAAVRGALEGRPSSGLPDASLLHRAATQALSSFDPEWGGFGGAPKFPRTGVQEQLLRYWRRSGSEPALQAVERTLDRMARGGLQDQVGGGFHRYSTDERWLVPHFEKMLYDNALLARAFLEGWQATGRTDFLRVCRRTLDYLLREMRGPEGAFYSATDADSEGEEGTFFVWTPAQIRSVLSPEQARVFEQVFGVTPAGNFEGRSIPWRARTPDADAAALGCSVAELEGVVEEACALLYRARADRPAPLLDDKRITGWNALVISALARAGLALDEPGWVDAAGRAASFFLDRQHDAGRLQRSYKDGLARGDAVLEDHAFLIAALLDLHEATQDLRWLDAALAQQLVLDREHEDPAGGYFTSARGAETLIAREKPDQDGAVPSGNSVAIHNLLRLAEITGLASFRERAERAIRAFAILAERVPAAVPNLLCAIDFLLDEPPEIAIVTAADGLPAMTAGRAFLDALGARFVPDRVLAVVRDGPERDAAARRMPFLEHRVPSGGRPTAHVCHASTCELPTTELDSFVAQIAPAHALSRD